jgi:adenylosuccinate lyase
MKSNAPGPTTWCVPSVRRRLTGPDTSYLHRGLGSSDVVDTAQSVLLSRGRHTDRGARGARVTRAGGPYRHTVMAGRTHGMS